MSKILHVLVYVFLVLAGTALYFELQLNAKRALLTDRNRMQEDYLVRIARTIEKSEPTKGAAAELKMDASPVEAKNVDSPDMDNVLGEYNAHLEQANLETYNWDSQNVRDELRKVYVTDPDGKPVMDGSEPLKRGSPEDKLLSDLFESAKAQQSRLNSTRAELTSLRSKLESAVNEINRLKPNGRQDKVSLLERDEKITKLESEKSELENQLTKLKAQIEELNTEITAKKADITAAKDETSAKIEELEKSQKLVKQLQGMLQASFVTKGTSSAKGAALTALPVGDKGKIVVADNDNMFAVVAFSEEALKELKGENGDQQLPIIELSVKRPGYKGPAGEFVGRIRLRQEVKGKPYVICDILSAWEQAKIEKNDVIFAD